MHSFEVTGGRRLKGEIIPQGAKNEALQILSAVLLTADPVTINNIPNIVDVNKLIELLGDLLNDQNELKMVALMKELVPEFRSNYSRFEILDEVVEN